MIKLGGTISGIDSSGLIAGIVASLLLHIAVFVGMPTPFGDTDIGSAESESSLHVSVKRLAPVDTTPSESQQTVTQNTPKAKIPKKKPNTIEEIPPEPVAVNSPKPASEPEPPIKPVKTIKAPEKQPPQTIAVVEQSLVIPKEVSRAQETEAKRTTEKPSDKYDVKTIEEAPVEKKLSKSEPPSRQESKQQLSVKTRTKISSDNKGRKTRVNKPSQVASSGSKSRLSRDYRSTILRLVERNKYYPLRARRGRIQGKTTVSFVVKRSGEIGNISIARSSKKRILDQAALKTIRRIGQAPPFPTGLKRSQWRFSVPITYALK